MSRLFFIICAVIMWSTQACAQGKFRFKSINQVGLLVGASKPAFQMQSVNGVSYRGYSVGLGVGMDNYYFKTIPLFVQVRKNILTRTATPFVYVDLGANLPQDKEVETSGQTSKFSSGLYYDIGIGYAAQVWKAVGLNVSIGYSRKETSENRVYGFLGADGRMESYDYAFRRLSLKLGFSFW